MRALGGLSAASVAFALLLSCQAPSQTAPATPNQPATVVASAPPTGAGRIDLLNAADAAYRSGDARTASELYTRVSNTPPPASETPSLTTAIDELARFRAMLAFVAIGDEAHAKDQLSALQEHDVDAPLTRLAAQFWDQYGMTAQLRAACNQLRPQLSIADATLATLSAAGATLQSQALCTTPGAIARSYTPR
jgi:hypothetical protein